MESENSIQMIRIFISGIKHCTLIQLSSNVTSVACVVSAFSLSKCKALYYSKCLCSTMEISNVIGNVMREANMMTKLCLFTLFRSHMYSKCVCLYAQGGGSFVIPKRDGRLYCLRFAEVLRFGHLKNSTYPGEDNNCYYKWRVLICLIVSSLTPMIFLRIRNQTRSTKTFLERFIFWVSRLLCGNGAVQHHRLGVCYL